APEPRREDQDASAAWPARLRAISEPMVTSSTMAKMAAATTGASLHADESGEELGAAVTATGPGPLAVPSLSARSGAPTGPAVMTPSLSIRSGTVIVLGVITPILSVRSGARPTGRAFAAETMTRLASMGA